MVLAWIIGRGGREHALQYFLSRNPGIRKVYTSPGNAGAENTIVFDTYDLNAVETIAQTAKEVSMDFTVPGPEHLFCNGIVDEFEERGLRIFGPRREAAIKTEGDKALARAFNSRHNIPQPNFEIFTRYKPAKDYLDSLQDQRIVVKAAGLAEGKGVSVCRNLKEAEKSLDNIMLKRAFGSAGSKVLVEEYIEGKEASVFALCDGQNAVYLPTAQDYKRIGEGDTGPNTGGTGSIAPLPLTDEFLQKVDERIVKKFLQGMYEEGTPYKGCLYVGIKNFGGDPYVIEYNCRFGDPETQTILPLVKNYLYELLLASVEGNLDRMKVEHYDKHSCCVVLMSKGYPGEYQTGQVIHGLDREVEDNGTYLFHADTRMAEGSRAVIVNGGRAVNIVGTGDKLEQAITKAYEYAEKVDFRDKYFRRDIGVNAMGEKYG